MNEQRSDLDSIEELNYPATPEEDVQIDAYVRQLQDKGLGSITHPHDLHLLFWDLSHRQELCNKMMRVAVGECIDDESLYTKFLGMARRYNGWMQKNITFANAAKKQLTEELRKKEAEKKDLLMNLADAISTIDRLKKEKETLRKAQKPPKESAVENALRQELKKEYNQQLQAMRIKDKPSKETARALILELSNPCSRFFETFDFSKQKDADEYIDWFRRAGRKVKEPLLRIIAEQYADRNIEYFLTHARKYNEVEWTLKHSGESEEE